ncbi:MAG: hypothetical protein ACI9TF_001876, partial [Paracrocinitomix sp.]
MSETTVEQAGAEVFNVRGPEQEMAEIGGNVPAAADLAIEDINPLNAHLFRENR